MGLDEPVYSTNTSQYIYFKDTRSMLLGQLSRLKGRLESMLLKIREVGGMAEYTAMPYFQCTFRACPARVN